MHMWRTYVGLFIFVVLEALTDPIRPHPQPQGNILLVLKSLIIIKPVN